MESNISSCNGISPVFNFLTLTFIFKVKVFAFFLDLRIPRKRREIEQTLLLPGDGKLAISRKRREIEQTLLLPGDGKWAISVVIDRTFSQAAGGQLFCNICCSQIYIILCFNIECFLTRIRSPRMTDDPRTPVSGFSVKIRTFFRSQDDHIGASLPTFTYRDTC